MEKWNYRINEKPPLNIMNYIQLYLIFTLFFFFIGPVQWNTQNTFFLLLLVIGYQLMFKLGYDYRINRAVNPARNRVGETGFWLRYFGIICIISIFFNILLFIRVTSLYGITSLFDTVILSFTDPTSLYHANVSTTLSSQMFGGRALAYINALASPITFAVIPIGLVIYSELSKVKCALFWIATLSNILLGISTGRGEGLMRVAVFAIIWFLLKGDHNDDVFNKKLTNKKKLLRLIGIVLVVLAFLYSYSALMQNRTLGSHHLPLGTNYIDYNNVLFNILPMSIIDLMIYLHIYLTQGYFGMSISLDKEWLPTFFCGFSSWFRGEMEGLLGIDIKSRTFMAQATDFGWQYGTNWHTAYTWFACDVWWLGVLVVMFLMGMLLAGSYKDAYYNHNPLAIGLLTLMFMFVIYLPANNYLFSDSDTFITFFVYLFFWSIKIVFSRRIFTRRT